MQSSRTWIIFMATCWRCKEARNLKVISRWGVGYDAIDVPAATRQGIVVAYTPGLLNEAVADFAFGLLLAMARRIHLGHLQMSQGEWKTPWGHDVHGKTLGISRLRTDRFGDGATCVRFQHAGSEL